MPQTSQTDGSKRLKNELQKKGGVAEISKKAGISKAQMGRYLRGTPIPSDKLLSLAKAMGTSAGWLLGEDSSTRESFNSYLDRTRRLSERLLRQLQRFNVTRAFLPSETAKVLEIMLLSQQHVIERSGAEWILSDYDLELGLHYLNGIRCNDWLDVYVDGCKYFSNNGHFSIEEVWANKWVMIVQEAFKSFNTREPMITDYFSRLNVIKLPQHTAHFALMGRWLEFLTLNLKPKDKIKLLDAGCGNGRHLVHMHQASQMLELTGVDISDAALKFCHEHERSGRLPKGTVQKGDFLDLPFEEQTFDAYISITNLSYIPLIRDSIVIGAGKHIYEAARVLKKGGYALFLMESNSVDEFYPFFHSSHDAELLTKLMHASGFKVIRKDPVSLTSMSLPGSQFGRGTLNQSAWILQKV